MLSSFILLHDFLSENLSKCSTLAKISQISQLLDLYFVHASISVSFYGCRSLLGFPMHRYFVFDRFAGHLSFNRHLIMNSEETFFCAITTWSSVKCNAYRVVFSLMVINIPLQLLPYCGINFVNTIIQFQFNRLICLSFVEINCVNNITRWQTLLL